MATRIAAKKTNGKLATVALEMEIEIDRGDDGKSGTWELVEEIAKRWDCSHSHVLQAALEEGIRGAQREHDRAESAASCGKIRLTGISRAVVELDRDQLFEVEAIAKEEWEGSRQFPGNEEPLPACSWIVYWLAAGMDAVEWRALGRQECDPSATFREVEP